MYIHEYILNMKESVMQTVRVFQSGNSQAIRIPREFALDESEMYIQKVGNSLILTSMKDHWSSLKASLSIFSDDIFNKGREQPKMQRRKGL